MGLDSVKSNTIENEKFNYSFIENRDLIILQTDKKKLTSKEISEQSRVFLSESFKRLDSALSFLSDLEYENCFSLMPETVNTGELCDSLDGEDIPVLDQMRHRSKKVDALCRELNESGALDDRIENTQKKQNEIIGNIQNERIHNNVLFSLGALNVSGGDGLFQFDRSGERKNIIDDYESLKEGISKAFNNDLISYKKAEFCTNKLHFYRNADFMSLGGKCTSAETNISALKRMAFQAQGNLCGKFQKENPEIYLKCIKENCMRVYYSKLLCFSDEKMVDHPICKKYSDIKVEYAPDVEVADCMKIAVSSLSFINAELIDISVEDKQSCENELCEYVKDNSSISVSSPKVISPSLKKTVSIEFDQSKNGLISVFKELYDEGKINQKQFKRIVSTMDNVNLIVDPQPGALSEITTRGGGYCVCHKKVKSNKDIENDHCDSSDIYLSPELLILLNSDDENQRDSARSVLYHELGHAIQDSFPKSENPFQNLIDCMAPTMNFDLYNDKNGRWRILKTEAVSDWISSKMFSQRVKSGQYAGPSNKEQMIGMLQGNFCHMFRYGEAKKDLCKTGFQNRGVRLEEELFYYPKTKREIPIGGTGDKVPFDCSRQDEIDSTHPIPSDRLDIYLRQPEIRTALGCGDIAPESSETKSCSL